MVRGRVGWKRSSTSGQSRAPSPTPSPCGRRPAPQKRTGASALGASRLFRCVHCPHPSKHSADAFSTRRVDNNIAGWVRVVYLQGCRPEETGKVSVGINAGVEAYNLYYVVPGFAHVFNSLGFLNSDRNFSSRFDDDNRIHVAVPVIFCGGVARIVQAHAIDQEFVRVLAGS